MFSVLMKSLLLASSGFLSLGSITLVILLLISDRGWRNGLSYALGYTCAYSLIGVFVVTVGYRTAGSTTGDGGLFSAILLLVLGTLLLWLALWNARKPVAADPGPPRFFTVVDQVTPLKAFGFGALVSVINFKNLALFLTALSVVILSDLPLSQEIAITLLVVLVFCLSVLIPVVIYLSFPKRAKSLLNTLKQTLNFYSRPIGIWAPLTFGFLFIVKAVTELL